MMRRPQMTRAEFVTRYGGASWPWPMNTRVPGMKLSELESRRESDWFLTLTTELALRKWKPGTTKAAVEAEDAVRAVMGIPTYDRATLELRMSALWAIDVLRRLESGDWYHVPAAERVRVRDYRPPEPHRIEFA